MKMVSDMLNEVAGWLRDNYVLLAACGLGVATAVNRIYYTQNQRFWHPKNLSSTDFYDHTRPVVEGNVIAPGPYAVQGCLPEYRLDTHTREGDITLVIDGLTEGYFPAGSIRPGDLIRAKVRERHGDERTLYDIL